MKTANALAAMGVVVMLPCLGCAKEQTRSPAQPVAAHVAPAAPTMGVTELQAPSDESNDANDEPILDLTPDAPSEPPAPDAQLGVRPDGTPVTAASIVLRGGRVPMPGERAHVAVRKTVPTTIEVVETSKPVAGSP